MKPERVQPPAESDSLDSSTTDDAAPGKSGDAPAADPDEKRPGTTSDMKPERVQKQ